MANMYGEKVKLNNVRLSFPTLDKPGTPRGYDDAEPKYSAAFLMDPEDAGNKATIKACKAEIERLIKEKWGERPERMKPIECFGPGKMFKKKETGEIYDGYEGKFVVTGNNKKRPNYFNRDKSGMSDEQVREKLYGGCYVDAIVQFWAQDNKFGEAIRCTLQGVRFKNDGEAFGGGGASADEFDDDDELGDGDDDLFGDDDL